MTSTREEIQQCFNLFDDDQTGHITLVNLKRVAKELGILTTNPEHFGEPLNSIELMEFIYRADTDGDGEISPEEFYAIMEGGTTSGVPSLQAAMDAWQQMVAKAKAIEADRC